MPPSDWLAQAPQHARDYLRDRRLDEVECVVADLSGIARGKAMPAAKFATQTHFHLPATIFQQTITGDWADDGDAAFTEPDMILRPDYTTARAAPWTADWTVQVIHDMADQAGDPYPVAPRNVLRRVVALYEARGWTPIVAPEMEFYLVARNIDPTQDVQPPLGRSGRRAAARQAYSMSAVDEYGPVIDDIYDFAEAMGLEIDGILQEGGAGQIEMNLRHGDPVRLADEIFYFKRLIREAALRADCYATFMAKPHQDEPGSAMHIHHSVVDTATGRNLFTDEGGLETPAFLHFIGGMQRHLPSVIALLAPYVNSYRRYVRDFAAPINLEWGRDNRTTGLRVPVSTPEGKRVENRIAGMDCNPYLGIAASLACGYLGLVNRIDPAAQFTGDAYDSGGRIPRDLSTALDLFAAATEIHEVLHPHFARIYAEVKRMENGAFLQVISPWEREHLLLNV
ncbi:glutamine synthetase family protein [Jannaschia sp. LMIT008]|uniref:glutamine synthetase family protein n=1 Tax=Jannaschia maritima TaxID=3032585 RepID=UPI0028110D97|nr:glutamine synthetase family protein [Jannaschia sp. LMIT008]